jgi:hypothetical protein
MRLGVHRLAPDHHPQYETPFKVPLGSSGFEHHTENNLKWKEINTGILDLGSLNLKVI